MALIDDDQVKEIGRELFVQAGPPLVFGDGLVGGEIELAAEYGFSAFDLPPGIAERGEDFVLGIVHEEVAVGEVENAGLAGRVALGIPL